MTQRPVSPLGRPGDFLAVAEQDADDLAIRRRVGSSYGHGTVPVGPGYPGDNRLSMV
jgi:hypothetical protein